MKFFHCNAYFTWKLNIVNKVNNVSLDHVSLKILKSVLLEKISSFAQKNEEMQITQNSPPVRVRVLNLKLVELQLMEEGMTLRRTVNLAWMKILFISLKNLALKLLLYA